MFFNDIQVIYFFFFDFVGNIWFRKLSMLWVLLVSLKEYNFYYTNLMSFIQ